MLDELTPAGAGLVLASIDLRRWGSGRAQVFAFVAAHEDWCEVSTQALERLLGLSRGWAQRTMRSMVERQVLELVPGAGTRPNAYRVQPDITAWVQVPWLIDPELVAHRVRAFHEEQGRAASNSETPVVARSMGARLGVVVARSYSARRTRVVARSRTARLEHVDESYPRGPRGARQAGASRAPQDRATSNGAPKEGVPSSLGDEDRSSLRPRRIEDLDPTEARAVRRIQHRAGGAWMRGAVLDRALEMVQRWGPDQIVAAVDRLPTVSPHQVKGLLDDLALEVAAGPDDLGNVTEPTAAELERRRESLRSLVATYEAEGGEPPTELLNELATCETIHNAGGG